VSYDGSLPPSFVFQFAVPKSALEKVAFLTGHDVASTKLMAHWKAIPVRYEDKIKGETQLGNGWMARKTKARLDHHFTETLRLLEVEADKLLDKNRLRSEFDEHMALVQAGKEEWLYHEAFDI
jgi:hypothetical protein